MQAEKPILPAVVLPPFLPDLYDLAIMYRGNPVLVAGHHRFSRKSRVHRGRVRTPEGDQQWLTLPIHSEDRKKPLPEVRLDPDTPWAREWMKQLTFCYSTSTYFDFFEPELQADLEKAQEKVYLLEATGFLFDRIRRYLELPEMTFTKAEELPEWDENPDQLAQNLGAENLYQEHRSRHYLRQADCRIDPPVTFPEFHQSGKGFVPWCCVLDLLFEYGPEAFKITDDLIRA